MNAENAFHVQQQVRENSEELQTYLKDLENWEKEMKKKDEELKLIKITDGDTIPPIRNSFSRSKKKGRHKKQKEKEKTVEVERISSYNYKAWEKFDAESELKKLDQENKESSASDSDAEDELNLQQRKQLAILKKDKGNDFFKKGMYDSAINCYTIGIDLDPENPLLPANRAMALLKKEQFQAAENDCTTCLSLDVTYIKAYLRRATARRALNKFSLAEEDYLRILELEPENKSALTELEKMRKDSVSLVNEQILNQNEASLNVENSKTKEDGESPSSRLENLLNAMDQPQPFVIPSNVVNDNLKQSSHSKCLPTKEHGKSKIAPEVEDLSEIENVLKELEQTLPPVPTASYQFLTDWRKVTKYPDLKYQYLKQFPPEKLPVLFKHDMEAEIFCGVLNTISSSFLENGDDIFPFMKYLTQVGRFQTLLLFLSSPEKNSLKKLVDHLKSVEHLSEVQELLKCYKV